MRGHIVKRSKNSYTIVLSLGRDPVTNKRLQQWVSVKGNKKDAEKRLSELLIQFDTGTFVKPEKQTVSEYLHSWLSDYRQNLAQKTSELYLYLIDKHIIPIIGNIPLSELKTQHLQKLYSKKIDSGLSNVTVQIIHRILHKALKDAVRTNLLYRNVSDYVDKPKVPRRQMKSLSESEVHLLLEYARDTEYYSIFFLALFTGMRRGELLALRWCDIDLDLCTISLTRNLVYIHSNKPEERIQVCDLKTAGSKRMIALSPSTVSMLREHKAKQVELNEQFGTILNEDRLVFCHADGSPLLPNSVTHAWEKLTRKCGLLGIRLHDTRHTHASLMLKQGVHPKVVQERLGHSSIRLTLDLYSHVTPGIQEAAANRFDDIFISKVEKPIKETAG
ncbi:MAG: site-specific integrase [Dehalococcoidales bacterium]|nr:site-specific integrase [Dehalococcoidales bacterium]